jgi:hypothetical protein
MEQQKSGEPAPNTVRRSTDEPDALDTTPTSEPMVDQPPPAEPSREDKRLKEEGDK